MKHVRWLLVIIFLATVPLPVFGGNYGIVTGAELKALIDRNEPGLVIIDSRSQSQYEESHIKGSTSIPLEEMEQNQELPKVPKAARLVFYCSGTT